MNTIEGNPTKSGVDPTLEAEADRILREAGLNENGVNEEEDAREKAKWQALGLEGDVHNAAQIIAEKVYDGAEVYDDTEGDDSSSAENREWQIMGLKKDVHSAAPEIAKKAFEAMSSESVSMDNPEAIGENREIGEEAQIKVSESNEKIA